MKYCETCGLWKKAEVLSDASDDKKAGGYCHSEKIMEDENEFEPDTLVYDYNEGGGFWTGPKFGCVHHKER